MGLVRPGTTNSDVRATPTAAVAARGRRSVLLAAGAVAAAVVLHLLAQAGMLFSRSDWTLSSFRQYFAADQLAYMSMVTNASQWQLTPFEPFTETGANYYPHLYYTVLGLLAGAFHLHPATAWQAGGLTAQVILVAVLAAVLIRIGRRWWLGLLAPAPFLLGTFSVLRDGNWFTSLESHAVLWGPFGVLFTLNGESASLSLGATALLLLIAVWIRGTSPRLRLVTTVVAAAIIGVLANVQTYSFLGAVYLAVFAAAAWALAQARARWLAAASAVLIGVVYLLGPVVAARTGQLPTLVFGLLPALPGVVLLVLRSKGKALLPFAAAVVTASPQVIATAVGLIDKDPFLVYRVASNKNLGVDWFPGLTGGIALLVPLLLILAAGLHRRRPLWISYPVAAMAVWTLLGTNDLWGANAEPYRLWIDAYLLIAVTTIVLVVAVASDYLGSVDAPREAGWTGAHGEAEPTRRRARILAAGAIALVAVTAGVSALDWATFFRADAYHALWSFTGPADKARAALADDSGATSTALLATDPCIDPRILKIDSGVPIAYYHLGMAWPDRRDALETFMEGQAAGTLDFSAAADAKVAFLLTDDSCPGTWASRYADELTYVAQKDYVDGARIPRTVTLWALPTAG
jgi:hypothetical protein